MPTFTGRIEAKYVVPSGGASVSVSSGAYSTAQTVTLAAGSYYHTAAGGVSSGITALQTAINAAMSPYPRSAAATAAMLGYASWSAGYLCDETSGNLAAVFGAPASLTAAGTPTYSNTGPGTGGDLAVGFNSNTDSFSAGNNFDLTNATDVCVAWVGHHTAAPTDAMFSKYDGGTTRGYLINCSAGALQFQTFDGSTVTASAAGLTTGAWYVGMAVADRSTGKIRVGFCPLNGSPTVSTEQNQTLTTTNTAAFTIGASAWLNGTTDMRVAALFVAHGASACSGLSTNLSTALTNFKNAVNSAFSVSLSTTTGLTTLSNSFWPCSIDFSSTTLRSLLGFEYEFNYPATAAQMATALGYGTWTSGSAWLCNESSGDLAPVFGSVTLADASTPTYSNLGPRGGNDKAVGFDSAADAFNGGDNFDVSSTEDLIVVWVGKFSAASGNRDVITKSDGTNGWRISAETTIVRFWLKDGTTSKASDTSTVPLNEWFVGIAAVDRAASAMRLGIRTMSGTSYVGSSTSMSGIGTLANAASFIAGAHAAGGYNNGSDQQIAAIYVAAGSGVASGLTANISTALTNFATYMKSQTGTQQARGLWFPDSPLNCDDHPSMAPRESDLRTTESPTGLSFGLCGNEKYVHTNVRYERSPVAQIREASATYDNASLEVFWRDTQTAQGGISWFTPASPVQIYWNNAGSLELLGLDANSSTGVAGWTISGASNFSQVAKPSQPGWVGQFDVRFPRLVSDG